jgi:N-acyl-D-aspartate/D-glutamate deacylase
VIALIHEAQRAGVTVSADQYPYEASGTSIVASIFPRWAEAGGHDSLLARIADPATHARLAGEVRENLRRRGGAHSLLIVSGPAFVGLRLDSIAALRGEDPVDAAFSIVRRYRDLGVASFNMNARDIEAFMKADFVTTGSDGSDGHPRKYGTFPKKLRDFVLDRPVLTMERMIASSTAQTARDLGIPRRGRLEPGWYADVIVFDPGKVRDLATYTEPTVLAMGMRWVFVNGRAAVDDGEPTGTLAGKALRRGDGR